jgi:hypothetical protein
LTLKWCGTVYLRSSFLQGPTHPQDANVLEESAEKVVRIVLMLVIMAVGMAMPVLVMVVVVVLSVYC